MVPFLGDVGETSETNGHTPTRPDFPSSTSIPSTQIYDLICVGFGPASLAIAIALQDATKDNSWRPNVCFLERQHSFGWHAGMLLPGAKMQISFIKDLATLRDPTSHFTFLNYLKSKNRLVQFANLGTFLPTRMEFEDYLRWCADHFSEDVEYGQDVKRIVPGQRHRKKFDFFTVETTDCVTGDHASRRARHVVIAVGGRPTIPSPFPHQHARIVHSSSYLRTIPKLLTDHRAPYRIAVVGSGQSAAEIFNDLHTRYPNSRTALIIKDTALRPSDDSPFVNEVFDPDRVDGFYHDSEDVRSQALQSHRSTNYGVVRLELLDHIYGTLYEQRIREPDASLWQHSVVPSTAVSAVDETSKGLRLTLKDLSSRRERLDQDYLDVDAVVIGTGYSRNAHEDILEGIADLKPSDQWHVTRDYRVELNPDVVSENAGIWLQGSNESTHGISDTLLSILATRSGELIDSMFGERIKGTAETWS